jgi:signal transduction histidine kinase
MVGFGFKRRSGRVISLARVMLATLFLGAVWADPSQPTRGAEVTYVMLAGYAAVSAAIAAMTWNSWWSDARLAGPAHILDVVIYTALVYSTEGYTSPFFLFFVFILLSAAIRWGWRETAVTAAALIMLYLIAGLAASSPETFELQRFIIRSGHLIILSALLIWFGVHQGQSHSLARLDEAALATPDESPLVTGLVAAARMAGAPEALLVWREDGVTVLSYRGGEIHAPKDGGPPLLDRADTPLIYDLETGRVLSYEPNRAPLQLEAASLFDREAARLLGLRRGLTVPLQLETGRGEIFLERIDGLSTDHLQFAEELSRAVAAHIRRHALLQAVEQSGEARARLSLARDLHDNVVQFLAGAAFRIEAMLRKTRNREDVQTDLGELKALMLGEQGDLRSYIEALRAGREIEVAASKAVLEALCGRLAAQWGIECRFHATAPERMIPMRLHIDAQQIVREAVANAVRHGGATSVRIRLDVDDSDMELCITDNGRGFAADIAASDQQPRTLRERAREAGGDVALASGREGTSLTITLPLKGRQR